MRIADRHGKPLTQVLSEYPESELPYWASWYSREPSDGQRIEFAVARFLSQYIAVHSKKGHAAPKPHELITPDWWAEHNRSKAINADNDAITQAFAEAGYRVITKRSH